MKRDGSNVRQLTDAAGEFTNPKWSPDGKKLLCGRRLGGGGISLALFLRAKKSRVVRRGSLGAAPLIRAPGIECAKFIVMPCRPRKQLRCLTSRNRLR
jgi:hypothetical protein